MKLKFAICEDDKTDTEYIQKLVTTWGINREISISIKIFQSAESFLFDYEEFKDYDILLLDIQMSHINGMELARYIREDNQYVQIIFITGYPDYILEGYDVSALHYLMKPIKKEKFFNTLNRAVENISKAKRSLIFSIGNLQKRVLADSILYAESFVHMVNITTMTENFKVKMTMYNIEKLFGDGFVRCHRSYIVGIKHISTINSSEIILDSGIKIPISRSAIKTVYDSFVNYYKGST